MYLLPEFLHFNANGFCLNSFVLPCEEFVPVYRFLTCRVSNKWFVCHSLLLSASSLNKDGVGRKL